jgi:hypothetical protein
MMLLGLAFVGAIMAAIFLSSPLEAANQFFPIVNTPFLTFGFILFTLSIFVLAIAFLALIFRKNFLGKT